MRAVVPVAITLLGVGGVVDDSRAQTTTTTVPWTSPAQETRVVGTAPPLEGRWLTVRWIGTPGAYHRSHASLWEVIRNPDGLTLSERHVVLPDDLRRKAESLDWNPSAAELQRIASAWDTLPSEARGIVRMQHELFGRDGFTDDIKSEPMTADARWVVRQTYDFEPVRRRPAKEIRLFAVERDDATGHQGAYLSAALAAAPMPIPIKLPGRFRLIRLTPTSRSLWSRITDVFRGCN
jgi:hypothetical protein